MDGLSSSEAKKNQLKFGKNEISKEKKESILKKILKAMCEPMFVLLLSVSIIYFVLGKPGDGFVMLAFVIGIIGIEIVQEIKTDRTLEKLKNLSSPKIDVIRDGKTIVIPSIDLVPDDIMIVSEGVKVPADGYVIECNDLCVDESLLSGESEEIKKVVHGCEKYENNEEDECNCGNDYWRRDYCYAGTLVTQGNGYILVDKIGNNTEYGKIGASLSSVPEESTPLQKQINHLVKFSTILAGMLFLLVFLSTFFISANDLGIKDRIIESILSGVTLAMAMIPEEFPVILTVFLSMGAWRLAKKNSLVRKLPSVETLGAISVLCTDKTGTLTINQMKVENLQPFNTEREELCKIAALSCEKNIHDPMEKAIISHCKELEIDKELSDFELLKEYTFNSKIKMMGNIWRNENKLIITAKGSPESIIELCHNLNQSEISKINEKIDKMCKNGLRVIAVAMNNLNSEDEIQEDIINYELNFCGIIGLCDPLRESIKADVKRCTEAGIRVIMITGDSACTASSIARMAEIPGHENVLTGNMIDNMTDEELREKVKTVSVFSRVIPEHKMKIVKALKDNGEIVAMIGDGVNDAPALKHANIGISMGKRGSEVSREASDLVLMDDNFTTVVETIKDGRRIYDNIKKSIGYIFSIHIPIALASLIAPILGIDADSLLFLPIHVVLMELIIDPTGSIVFERQPAEKDIMKRSPRANKEQLSNKSVILKSIIQGIMIFIASFGSYYYILTKMNNLNLARSMGLSILIFSNLFLVLINSSEKELSILQVKHFFKDKYMLMINILIIIGLLLVIYSPVNSFFGMQTLSLMQLFTSIALAFVFVFWYDVIKLIKNKVLNKK